MHIFLNTQCLKQIILIITGCAVLVGCTAPIIPEYAGIKSITGEPVNDVLDTFKKGEARLTCESDGCLQALNTIPHMTLYNNWEWNELVFGVAKSGYSSNLTYYYFGRAAEGFGYDSAAATYYQLGLGNVPHAWGEGRSKDHATSFIRERLKEMEYRLSKQAEDEKKQAELASITLAENKRIEEEAEAERKREAEEQKAKAEARELAEQEKLDKLERLLDSAKKSYTTTLSLENKTYYQKEMRVYSDISLILDFTIIGNTKEYAKIGNISKDCKIINEKSIPEMSYIYIIGSVNCNKELFYTISYKGKEYNVDSSYVEGSYIFSYDTEKVYNLRNKLNEFSKKEYEMYKNFAISLTESLWKEEKKEGFKNLVNAEKNGIIIEKANIYDESKYTDGTGLNISFYNPSEKTIKYITTNVIGYNAVKDPVKDIRNNKIQIQIKGVGPINPNSSGEYSHDYLWLTDLVQSFDIVSIYIQYMDGSSKTVKDINKAWTDQDILGFLEVFNTVTE